MPSDTGKAAKPAAVKPEHGQLEELVGELAAKVASLEEQLGDALEKRLNALVTQQVGAGEFDEIVRRALEPYVEALEAIVEKGTLAGGEQLGRMLDHAHARIDALLRGVERGIGISVPMPENPGDAVSAHPTVPGAETVDSLA